MKPIFIALEGIDGSGKTTQCELLTKYYEEKGKKVLLINFPACSSYFSEDGKNKKNIYEYDYVIFDSYVLSTIIRNIFEETENFNELIEKRENSFSQHFFQFEFELPKIHYIVLDCNFVIISNLNYLNLNDIFALGHNQMLITQYESVKENIRKMELLKIINKRYIDYSKDANIPIVSCMDTDYIMRSKEFINNEIVQIVAQIEDKKIIELLYHELRKVIHDIVNNFTISPLNEHMFKFSRIRHMRLCLQYIHLLNNYDYSRSLEDKLLYGAKINYDNLIKYNEMYYFYIEFYNNFNNTDTVVNTDYVQKINDIVDESIIIFSQKPFANLIKEDKNLTIEVHYKLKEKLYLLLLDFIDFYKLYIGK